MNLIKPGNRIVWGLVSCLVVLGLCGCVSAPFGIGIESTFAPQSPARSREVKPSAIDPKPAEADNRFDERHPSRWRKKLRAKYA